MTFELTRREALAGIAATIPLAGCTTMSTSGGDAASLAQVPGPSLDALARRSGRRFGSCIGRGRGGGIDNPAYTAILAGECGVVVPENELKWQATRPGPETFDFARLDAIVAWAKANSLAIRGHTLLWHRTKWSPKWLNDYDFGANPVREAERLLTTHIRTVTDRYRGVIHSYDVVNETVLTDGTGLEQTSLSRAMGSSEAVVDLAFHTAREQLPDAQLVYNDYMSWEPDHRNHCAGVLRFLEGLRKRNVPVDALGIQSHIEMFSIDPSSGVGPYDEAGWRRFLDEVVGMGYKLLITEFDVKDKALPGDIALRDERVADFTRRYFDLMLEYKELSDILAWGMVDRFNWLQGFAPRDDDLEVRGTPYGSDYRPKPLRTALAESFAAAA
ncbi:glycosyl hydrolase [Altererythrobacter salegens]|uniref:Beta-xylanase n=1 Tax=Croceibacterium salegens TaxID=1737568 RepID=A0A6I4SVN9_9SPHN|nr:endo-1,4-beta-xylanase [Croceibacterium salegens]MXO60174.1 glycosyl hydrolase [Croceibacterium salegens]